MSSSPSSDSTNNPHPHPLPVLLPPIRHPFWETQPVPQLSDAGDFSLPVGPIIIAPPPPTTSDDINISSSPSPLPSSFEWISSADIDIDDDPSFAALHRFLSQNSSDGTTAPLPFAHPAASLRWLLRHPRRIASLHVAVRAKNSKKLVGFVAGTPTTIRIGSEAVRVVVANVLCVHKKLRSKRLAPVLIRELARRARVEGISQGLYATTLHLPTPFCTSRLLYRILNPKKIKRCGHVVHAVPREELSISRLTKWFKVATMVETRGLRKMESGDVIAVSELLKAFLNKFEVALEVDEHFVEHFLVPKVGLVDTYVVEDLETNEITDFCSFLIHNVPVENDPKYSELKCVVLFYYAANKTSLLKMMKDLLVVAKEDGADLFLAYDVMGNGSVLDRLLFRPKVNGDERTIHYYFYNYRLTEGLEPQELGLIV